MNEEPQAPQVLSAVTSWPLLLALTGVTLGCGGAVILWQANQTWRWGMLHDEVDGIVWHVNREKAEKGAYPASLEDYEFQHPELRDHIGYTMHDGKLSIGYHLSGYGISYRYREDSGFGCYPE